MRKTIRGAVLTAGTLVALSGLFTAAAAAPLAPCTPSSEPTARGVCLPLDKLKDLGAGLRLSRSPDCGGGELCAFVSVLRSPSPSAVRSY
ncbi:hypothetical protein OG590_00660 [Streptomyces goshikiensis]|uniref:hypothetical protein n=1 Tax=Streptomyces goshikiensis TaxID=1942 RepID=UPI00378BD5F8|nr:hypothetical protein OG590_00660 [Streptomyces goshikiensis]